VTTVSETVRALYTIRDLGWPIALLDLAIGVMRDHGRVAPVYFCGSERGYEAESYPGLYDPSSGGQVGPLINALESYSVTPDVGRADEPPAGLRYGFRYLRLCGRSAPH
jgi:hypothetical protein